MYKFYKHNNLPIPKDATSLHFLPPHFRALVCSTLFDTAPAGIFPLIKLSLRYYFSIKKYVSQLISKARFLNSTQRPKKMFFCIKIWVKIELICGALSEDEHIWLNQHRIRLAVNEMFIYLEDASFFDSFGDWSTLERSTSLC